MSLAAVITRSKTERESWRYTDLEKLLPKVAEPSVAPKQSVIACATLTALRNNLVFVNGVWDAAQSHMADLPTGAFSGDAKAGYKLKLEGQTCLVTSPVELLFITNQPGEYSTQLDIELGVSGRLTLIERFETSAYAGTHILHSQINLHPQAKFVHGKIIKGGASHTHLALTKVEVAEGAYYDNFTLIKDCKLVRNEIETSLDGKLAQCNLNGAMLLRGHEHADTTTRITHAVPYGTSREIYKSVVAEQARAVFQGKILVKEGAQKTDGHQLSRALLLSDQAEMDAKPELEIYADDVKCSHGSTIGDLDSEAMFYLRARGLSEQEARSLLIEAFASTVLDEIHADDVRDMCRSEIEGWLHAAR
jgi:Fe-S cluster assembly protein SufD